jgi:RNA polymerase sigma-70 factor (ECF subfamily)
MENAAHAALFAEATREHMGILLKTAHAFATPADRDDLVQEMLLAVWQALPAFDAQRCKLSTFLYRVTQNRAQNWNRSQRRYRRRLDALEHCPHLAFADSPSDAAGAGATARLEWLYALIRELPPVDRTVLLLHLEQLSHREIGEVTGLSENHIGVRLHRIKRWLGERRETHHEL